MPSIQSASRRVFGLLCVSAAISLSSYAQSPLLSTHVPALVKTDRAERLGPMASSQTLKLVVSLPLRNQSGLDALLADLYNPASPNYRQWLTPAQFDAQFGPTVADYQALTNWATRSGLKITATAGNRRILSVEGSTGVVNLALHIQEMTYHDKGLDRDFIAPDREPTIDLDIPVYGIAGLDTSNPKVNRLKKKPTTDGNFGGSISYEGTSAPKEPSITGSGPGNTYLPSDMRAAYYGTGSLTGTGQSVAIYSYDSYLASDVTLWHTKTSTTSSVAITNELVNGFSDGSCPGSSCDDGEQVLDIVQVQGMAPGLAHIYFYESDSSVTELNQMVSDDLAATITSSWGGGDFGPVSDSYFLQMAAQGQTYFNATGDSGGFNGFTYDPPSLDPNIVQVGGTDLTTVSAGGAWKSETAWADSGGGFFDPFITIPTWQQTTGVITSTNKGSTTLRNSPDMAAEANFDNTTVIDGTFESGYGGTSYATPRMAGYAALANQQSVTNGTKTLGFINPALYEFGLLSTASTIYHDITSGSAPSASAPTVTYSAVAGYDDVTGWGSPNGTGLLNALIGPDFSLTAASSTVEVNRSSSNTISIAIAAKNGFTATPTFTVTGLPTGVTASFGTPTSTAVVLTLTSASTTLLSTDTITVTGKSGVFSHSTSFVLTAGKRANDDFTLSATAATAAQEATGSSTVTVTPGAGLAGAVTISVSGLPAGVTASVSPASTTTTAVVTFTVGIASAPGTYSAVITGTAGGGVLSHSIPVSITITAVPSVLLDGGFEQTTGTSPWKFTSTTTGGAYLCNEECGFFQHSGSYFSYMNGFGATDTDTLSQTFTVSGGTTSATLNLWLMIYSAETSTTAKNDTFTITVTPSGGTATTLATFSNLNKSSAYALYTYDLTAYLGKSVTLQFQGVENNTKATAFFLDDISVVVK